MSFKPASSSRAAVALVALTVLGACTMIPTYDRPGLPVADAFPQTGEAVSSASSNREAADLGWRDMFPDPVLRTLLRDALDNNRDLRIAALNVEAARASYRIQRSDFLPRLDAVATSTAQRTPDTLALPGAPEITRAYSASVAATAWEIDLWGRVRSLNQQALAAYLSRDETRRAAELSLIAEVANAYLTLRADQAALRLAQETVRSQERSVDLTRDLEAAGQVGRLDLRQAEIALRAAQSDLSLYGRRVAQDRNALVLLVGAPLSPEMSAALAAADTLPDDLGVRGLPAGAPSSLLERRPDIRAAEFDLIGANAGIGAARAAFFPRLSLTGSTGAASSALDDLFDTGATAWSFSPRIVLPIFNAGALRASLDRSELLTQVEVARYERTIQVAFREVADGLAGQATFEDQIAVEILRVEAGREALALATQRYEAGEDSYLAVLDAQRSVYGAEQALIRTRLGRLSNLVTLYKALGGGWTEAGLQADAALRD
ncbi:MAG: efflux transporter outer membrane subunit [Brevundimonas sp.]|uniref:efflux transporter outer membrane subunit n=1 Tax=Brevundimonas sp. TaxID=1871086 RepID=UPI00258CB353|nr:efflux transporter outer membrane subunit [Brevundimonas sp.]MCV0415696.1 efflux transporter outer membrane subunit [Brevundimonas sp.]